MERAGGSISLGDGARSIQPPSPPRNRPTKTPASQRLTDSAALQATAPSQAAAPSQATAKLGWRLRPVSRSRDALQRVGTSAPIYAALAERLSSLEGASHPGDGFSRRRGPGSAPRPTTAAARPPVAGPGQATSCSASSASGSASRSHTRAVALAAERAARAARKELQQRQHFVFEEEQPLALQLRALQLRAFIAARQAAVCGNGGAGGAGSNGTGGGLSCSSGVEVAAEEALEKALEKERREAEKVKEAITVKVKGVKDTMEKEQKAARAVKDMEKEQEGVMASQVSQGRSRSAGICPSVARATASSSHNGRDGGGVGCEGGGGGGGGCGGGGSCGDRIDTMPSMAHRMPSASPDCSGGGLRGGPIRTESLMDRLGAKGWLPVGAPSSSCLTGAVSSSPGIRAALAAAMREPSSVAYSWRSSEADTEIHTEYTSGLFSQNPTDRFTSGPLPVVRVAHHQPCMGNVQAALTMRLQLPLVRRSSPPRAVGTGAPAAGTRGWFDAPDDADLLSRPEPHLLPVSLDENYERHEEGGLSREQRDAIADFTPEEQRALDACDLFAAYDELDEIYQATPVGTQRAQLRAPRPKGSGKSISKSTKHEGGEPAQLAQLAQRPGTYSPPLRALLDQLGAHPSREGEGEALDERHHRATEATIAAAIGIGKDNGSLPIRRREVGRSLGLGAPGPSHRSAASSRSRGRKAAKTGVGRKVTKLGASCSVG